MVWDAKSQASSLRCREDDYFAVYSSLIYYSRPVWRVLLHVCLSYDILQLDIIEQFQKEEVGPSTCQIFFSQWMDFASKKHERICIYTQYMREPAARVSLTHISVLRSLFLNFKNQPNLCSALSCNSSND